MARAVRPLNRQRGNIYFYFVGALLALGLLWGLVHAWDSYTSGLVAQGKREGKAEADAAYKARDNEQLQAVIAERDKLQRDKDTKEADARVQVQRARNELLQEQENAKLLEENILARVADGSLQLRGTGSAQAGSCTPSGGSGAPGATAGTAAGNNDAGQGGVLSASDSTFLIREALRADEVVRLLTTCQAVIVLDRKLTNGTDGRSGPE